MLTEAMQGKFEVVTYYQTTYQVIEELIRTHLKCKTYPIERKPFEIIDVRKWGSWAVHRKYWVAPYLKEKGAKYPSYMRGGRDDVHPPLQDMLFELVYRGALEGEEYLIIDQKEKETHV